MRWTKRREPSRSPWALQTEVDPVHRLPTDADGLRSGLADRVMRAKGFMGFMGGHEDPDTARFRHPSFAPHKCQWKTPPARTGDRGAVISFFDVAT